MFGHMAALPPLANLPRPCDAGLDKAVANKDSSRAREWFCFSTRSQGRSSCCENDRETSAAEPKKFQAFSQCMHYPYRESVERWCLRVPTAFLHRQLGCMRAWSLLVRHEAQENVMAQLLNIDRVFRQLSKNASANWPFTLIVFAVMSLFLLRNVTWWVYRVYRHRQVHDILVYHFRRLSRRDHKLSSTREERTREIRSAKNHGFRKSIY